MCLSLERFFCQILVPRSTVPSLHGATAHSVLPQLIIGPGNTVCVTIRTGKLCASWEMDKLL